MGARDLLHELRGAGFVVEAEADRLLVRPASKLNDEQRAAVRQSKAELLALLPEQARDPAADGAVSQVEEFPLDPAAATLPADDDPAVDDALPQVGDFPLGPAATVPDLATVAAEVERGDAALQAGILPLAPADPDRWCWPASSAANTREVETMTRRLDRLARLGFAVDAAERIADKLLLRDREGDDRRTCIECRHLRAGCCSNWQQAGLCSTRVNGGFWTMFQRCDGFAAVPHPETNERNP